MFWTLLWASLCQLFCLFFNFKEIWKMKWKALWCNICKVIVKLNSPICFYATVHSYNSIEANIDLRDFSLDQAGYAISLVDSLLAYKSPKSSGRSFLASACKRHRESSTQQLFSCVAVGCYYPSLMCLQRCCCTRQCFDQCCWEHGGKVP